MSDEENARRLNLAIAEMIKDPDISMKRDRPYLGQPHTDGGERGKTEIRGLTFRDLRDCYVRAWCLSTGADTEVNRRLYDQADKGEDALLNTDSLFAIEDADKVSPLAVFQNMSCEIEKVMGIYPNVPKLTVRDDASVEEMLEEAGAPILDARSFPCPSMGGPGGPWSPCNGTIYACEGVKDPKGRAVFRCDTCSWNGSVDD